MKTYVLLLVMVLSDLCLAGGSSSSQFVSDYLENPRYGLVWDNSDQVLLTCRIVRYADSSRLSGVVLDSLKVQAFPRTMCDTNAIAFIGLGDSTCDLVVSVLSPKVVRETLFTSSYGPGGLLNATNLAFLLPHSILAVEQEVSDSTSTVEILKLGDDRRQYRRVRLLTDASIQAAVADYSQVLMVQRTGERLEIVIYDATTDSLEVLAGIAGIPGFAKRLNRSSPIFYLKREGGIGLSLFKYVEGSGEQPLAPLIPRESVESIGLVGDSLEVKYSIPYYRQVVRIPARDR